MTRIIIKAMPERQEYVNDLRRADLMVGSRWDNNYMMNQCVYMPAGFSMALHEYYYRWPGKVSDPTGSDIMIDSFLRSRGEKYWIQIPNLVDHRQCRSLIDPRRSSRRQSKTFRNPMP